MMDRNYGTSGYIPTRINEQRRVDKAPAPKKKHPLRKRILKWVLFVLAVLLFFIWLFMGEFRFLFWRSIGLSGFPFGNRTYLVLFQDNYELRPTGGFISTYGELTFSHGIYTGIEFHDIAELDAETKEAPLVISALMGSEDYAGYSFKDANFDPDFNVAKDKLIEFYQLTNPDTRVDGVIAADFTFLEDLVALYEPLSVEGHELTDENLFEALSFSDVEEERTDLTGPIVHKILFKSFILPWRLLAIRDLAVEAFEEKHLIASFNRSGLQSSFSKRNWDGALPQSDLGDFVAINVANYGGLKSDRYLTRDVEYELTVTDQTDVLGNPVVIATVNITLSHEGTVNPPLSGVYTGYLRTLIPLGSNLQTPVDITEERDDVYVLGQMLSLAPGETVTYSYTYELPEYVWSDDRYYLHLHKQPGTEADHYRVVVHMPQGVSMNSSSFDVRENVAFFDSKLRTDTNLTFTLTPDETPPHIVTQEITALNEITLTFNEPIAAQEAEDAANYAITDLDERDQVTTDELRIVSVRVEGSRVILTTEGMTAQPEERYEVTLQNLTDREGNALTPSPRTVTLIQRLPEEETEEPEEEVDAEAESSDNTVSTDETTNE